ncbi:MAG: hypothetical protein AB1486_25005 [Planctomycetota bacterium]
MLSTAIVGMAALVFLAVPPQEVPDAAGPGEERPLGAIDLAAIRELYHLTDTLGADLWPDFDTRTIPIAINNHDREELLVGHPKPPPEFRLREELELDGASVWVREGCTLYGPRGGGWAVTLGGEETAYVGIREEGQPTERYLSLLLHECFHVYQKRFHKRVEGAMAEGPEDAALNAAWLALESRILDAALRATGDDDEVRALAEQFVAVRHARRARLSDEVVRLEGEQEFNEGTATYVQARLYQLLAEHGGIAPVGEAVDPHYHGFADAAKLYDEMIAGVLPPPRTPVGFFHAMYHHGMAQGLLLDRVRPEWKEEMTEAGAAPFHLLEREMPLTQDEESALVERAVAFSVTPHALDFPAPRVIVGSGRARTASGGHA